MSHRTRNILLSLLILLGGWAISRLLLNQKEHLKKKPTSPPPVKQQTMAIQTSPLSKKVHTSGRSRALNKIEIYAEVTGVLLPSSSNFRTGTAFNKGDVLLEIDDSVYRNNLLSQRSAFLNHITLMLPDLKIDIPAAAERWEKYLNHFSISQPIPDIPTVANQKEQFYLASHSIYERFYTIRSMEATWNKYRITAPYDGVLTQSLINPGTLVRAGQKLGEFTSIKIYEIEMAVRVNEADFIRPGQEVRLYSDDLTGSFTGKVVRVNKAIDPTTQTVSIFVQVQNSRLKDGMYMEAELQLLGPQQVSRIPSSAIINDSLVEIVQNKQLKRIPITSILEEDHFLYVTGLDNGMILNLTPGVFPSMTAGKNPTPSGRKGMGQ